MALPIILERKSTGEIANVILDDDTLWKYVSELYINRRFGLPVDDFVYRIRRRVDGFIEGFIFHKNVKLWKLVGGSTYFIECNSDQPRHSPEGGPRLSKEEKGKAQISGDIPTSVRTTSVEKDVDVEVVDLTSSSGDSEDIILDTDFSRVKDEFPMESPLVEPVQHESVPDVPEKIYSISALEAFLHISGTSELLKFRKQEDFDWKQVDCMPDSYNRNVVFELPPVDCLDGRGKGLQNMDRKNDCYSWTRLLTTSANIRYQNMYKISKASCFGVLECQNLKCSFLVENLGKNEDGWTGRVLRSYPHPAGEQLSDGGLVCSFCRTPPFCVNPCAAKMFYIHPKPSIDTSSLPYMSHLAVHVGIHDHRPRKIFSRQAQKKVSEIVHEKFRAVPQASPSRLRNVSASEILKLLHPDSIKSLRDDEEKELWESLKLISTPAKFATLLKSISRLSPGHSEFDAIIHMQKHIKFPCIQRFLFPGQAEPEARCHIFKMTTQGMVSSG
ncbi:unnamed protein product [Calypogeia fissa]